MKKLLVVLLTALMTLGLVGCGKVDKPTFYKEYFKDYKQENLYVVTEMPDYPGITIELGSNEGVTVMKMVAEDNYFAVYSKDNTAVFSYKIGDAAGDYVLSDPENNSFGVDDLGEDLGIDYASITECTYVETVDGQDICTVNDSEYEYKVYFNETTHVIEKMEYEEDGTAVTITMKDPALIIMPDTTGMKEITAEEMTSYLFSFIFSNLDLSSFE